MQSVSVAVAKDKLPSLLHLVEQGEDIEITRHGKPIAIITHMIEEPVSGDEPSRFEIAYRHFREQIEADSDYTDEDWNEYFNIPREIQTGIRHEEDFS